MGNSLYLFIHCMQKMVEVGFFFNQTCISALFFRMYVFLVYSFRSQQFECRFLKVYKTTSLWFTHNWLSAHRIALDFVWRRLASWQFAKCMRLNTNMIVYGWKWSIGDNVANEYRLFWLINKHVICVWSLCGAPTQEWNGLENLIHNRLQVEGVVLLSMDYAQI